MFYDEQMILTSKSKVWRWGAEREGGGAWHFITLDAKSVAAVKKTQEGKKRIGWGSVPVVATVGDTRWKTSIFPDSKSGSYLLPLKASVRKREGVAEGDTVAVSLVI